MRIPDRRRAIRIPSIRPETTMERAAARRWGGARSPTRGSISWGVTVMMPVMKLMAEKTAMEEVTQSPILGEQNH